jgi:hypothetical protein
MGLGARPECVLDAVVVTLSGESAKLHVHHERAISSGLKCMAASKAQSPTARGTSTPTTRLVTWPARYQAS